ncbi:phosphatidate phosphatase PAH2 [Quillaja saponaria]|uniref:Phosphatidate phosphatase PAH2 n=1 Tax=Quillaja saponaria TaxID=32244 RepID=A0AAD7LYE3_QUISA|nr:phosphatidate phosphatase PAH2 [Quillaja saponaria]
MYAVQRLGSYITQGVYTVSGPFHPFGGAVDIVVVEQQDGSFKSSPWYVRFGKFQGVLKSKEKVVNISVNGIEANFHMYLDNKGEAYFLREVNAEEGESIIYQSSSGDEKDCQSHNNKRSLKSRSLNFDSMKSNSVDEIDMKNGKIVAETSPQQSKILGLVLGRRSLRRDDYKEEVDGSGIPRRDSLESAEIAANLLEVNWSTNPTKPRRNNTSEICASDMLDCRTDKDIIVDKKLCHGNSSEHDFIKNSLVCSELQKEASSCNTPVHISSMSRFEDPRKFVKKDNVDFSCLTTTKQVVESSTVGESVLEGQSKMMVQVSTSIDKYIVGGNEHDMIVKEVIAASTKPHLTIPSVRQKVCPDKHVNGEEVFDERGVGSSDCGILGEEILTDGVQSFVYCRKSDSSIVGVDCSKNQTDEVAYLACGGQAQVQSHHTAIELLPEVIITKESIKDIDFQIKRIEDYEIHSEKEDFSDSSVSSYKVANVVKLPTSTNPEMINVDPRLDSVEVESQCIGANSRFSSSASQVQYVEEDFSSNSSPPLQSLGGCLLSKATSAPPSMISEEGYFLFSDLDEYITEGQCMESNSHGCEDREYKGFHRDGTEKVNQSVNTISSSHSCLEISAEKILPTDVEMLNMISNSLDIPKSHKVTRKEVGQLSGSLPIISSNPDSLDKNELHYPLSHSLDSKSKSFKWAFPGKDESGYVKSNTDKENRLLHEQPILEHPSISAEFNNVSANPALDPLKASADPGGNWSLWPFSHRCARSMITMQPAPKNASNSTAMNVSESTTSVVGDKSEPKPKMVKKMVRETTPASEQLASLNLKDGSNIVTFSFSTAMLGKQQVDARIYLWKWNARIVISDVDGTITKSDVLGQFMPLVGIDWSQTGVAHLFSAVKENGYQLLFLSARAISQAYNTRQFLFNLKQDGKALPDGPVVISPDGLFPSLYREVIRRAPHEFKIACLEDIKALFPSDCNPFYAGFGNRDTDEISYLKVGIPKGKIFIINPKGEISVNRRLDTKSYTSLHTLVNGMFPPTNTFEQEDFNSWNYWKLPDPVIDI